MMSASFPFVLEDFRFQFLILPVLLPSIYYFLVDFLLHFLMSFESVLFYLFAVRPLLDFAVVFDFAVPVVLESILNQVFLVLFLWRIKRTRNRFNSTDEWGVKMTFRNSAILSWHRKICFCIWVEVFDIVRYSLKTQLINFTLTWSNLHFGRKMSSPKFRQVLLRNDVPFHRWFRALNENFIGLYLKFQIHFCPKCKLQNVNTSAVKSSKMMFSINVFSNECGYF